MQEQTKVNPTNTVSSNPASSTVADAPVRRRIPMSVPTRKLEVPDMPGWRLYWFKDENIPRALQAGYELVKDEEVALNRNNVAGHPGVSANTDLGTKVSLVGGRNEDGSPARLILMKIKLEWFQEDQMELVKQNTRRLEAIFDKEQILGPGGQINERGALTYVDQSKVIKPLFNRPARKAKIGRS